MGPAYSLGGGGGGKPGKAMDLDAAKSTFNRLSAQDRLTVAAAWRRRKLQEARRYPRVFLPPRPNAVLVPKVDARERRLADERLYRRPVEVYFPVGPWPYRLVKKELGQPPPGQKNPRQLLPAVPLLPQMPPPPTTTTTRRVFTPRPVPHPDPVNAAPEDELPEYVLSESCMRGSTCAVAHCRAPYPRNVSFHRIPKNPMLRRVWVRATHRLDPFDPDIATICSQHFKEEDFERNLYWELMHGLRRKKLKKGAVPSQNLTPATATASTGVSALSAAERSAQRKERFEKRMRQDLVKELLSDPAPYKTVVKVEDDGLGADGGTKTSQRSRYRGVYAPFQERGTQTPEEKVNLSEVNKLRAQVKALEKRLRNTTELLDKEREKKYKPDLEELEWSKKMKIAKEVMVSCTPWSKTQVDHFLGCKERTKWKNEDYELSLTLRALSPRTYRFLRDRGLLPLPSKTSIRLYVKRTRGPDATLETPVAAAAQVQADDEDEKGEQDEEGSSDENDGGEDQKVVVPASDADAQPGLETVIYNSQEGLMFQSAQ